MQEKNKNIRFKEMGKDDLHILHLWFHLPHVLKWYARDEQYTFEMIQEKYLPRINDVSIPNFIIYDNDKPVGYIQFYCGVHHLPEGIIDGSHPLFDEYTRNNIAGIDLFIADKNYLHTGFSSYAFNHFIDIYIKNKFKAVLVDPVTQNLHAISFFERNGFEHIISQDGNHALMIRKI